MTTSSRHLSVAVADSRHPLVLDVRTLGRRPGTMWEGEVTAAAPAGLGRDLIGVLPGADLHLELRLESVLDGILVTADVTADVVGECARCLDEVRDTINVGFTELWSFPADRYARTAGESVEDDGEIHRLNGDLLDLEQAVRDAVVLALVAQPLCQEDCQGLCSMCGERLGDAGSDHRHEANDPRWAALGALQGLTDRSTED